MSQLAKPSDEYAKNPKLRKEDVEILREWASKQPHLPNISDLQFVLFLQSCYYSIEKAKQAIENYFTIRTICKDLFQNPNPKDPAIQMALDVGVISFLPKLAPNTNYQVVFMRLLDTNPDKYVYLDQTRMFDMVMTLQMHVNGTNEGMLMVMDMEGSVFGHLLKMNPSVAKKFMFYLQEGLPIRLRAIHIINVPSWIDKMLSIIKPLMKKELFELIQIHTNMESFYKIVPCESLPKDYGGTGAEETKITGEKNREWLEKNAEFFQKQAAQTTDESKRTEKTQNYDRIFGVEGSFKKLDVD